MMIKNAAAWLRHFLYIYLQNETVQTLHCSAEKAIMKKIIQIIH